MAHIIFLNATFIYLIVFADDSDLRQKVTMQYTKYGMIAAIGCQ